MSEKPISHLSLDDIFTDVNPSFIANHPAHKTKFGVEVLEISTSIDYSFTEQETRLGKPRDLVDYVAIVRQSPFFLSPKTGRGRFSVDRSGVLLIFQRTDGSHVGILPLSGTSDSCTSYLKSSSEADDIVVYSQNDSDQKQENGQRVLIATSPEFTTLVSSLFSVSREVIFGKSQHHDNLENMLNGLSSVSIGSDVILGSNLSINGNDDAVGANYNTSMLPWKSEWYDGLIYCTWNGLGSVLSHESIISALSELDSLNVRITGLIIDDGWQHTNDKRQLYDLRADESRFPTGLKGLVDDIRQKFPYFKDVAVWSTLTGYWSGIVPGSELDQKYKTVDVNLGGGINPARIVSKEDVLHFYYDYFESLFESGITSVKIDYQATIDEISDPSDRGSLWLEYQNALFDASLSFFDGKVIYCMAMVPNIMLYSLQRTKTSTSQPRPIPVLRNSDDFFPNILSSHFWHIYSNLYNTIYTGNLYALPDFDMFQTKLEQGDDPLAARVTSLHAAARCISGGPVYFTDTPNRHDLDLLRSFSAPSKSNQSIVLRPTGIAGPVFPYQPFEGNSIHWAYNYSDLTEVPTLSTIFSIILGAFNITYDEVTENTDWSNLLLKASYGQSTRDALNGASTRNSSFSADDLVLRSYKTGTIWPPKSKDASVSLLSGEWDIVTAAPLIPVPSGPVLKMVPPGWYAVPSTPSLLHLQDEPSISLFGLVDNICGVSALHSYEIEKTIAEDQVGIKIWLKAYGKVGIYTSFPINKVEASVDGVPVEFSKITVTKLLEIDIRNETGSSDIVEGSLEDIILLRVVLS